MHPSSMDKMRVFKEQYLESKINERLVILDLGSCDINGSYKEIFDVDAWVYYGLDLAKGKNVDIVLKNPYHWKEIRSDTADVIISGQAFEHIEYFWITILEMARTIKSGGLCCLIAPAGGFEHRYPVDCWRFYPDGFSALAKFAGLKPLEVRTQWEPDPKYTTDSNVWQDTVMVCKKPLLTGMKQARERLRRLFFASDSHKQFVAVNHE